MEFHDRLKNKTQLDLEESTLSADDIEAALRQELQESEE
jgi:DNA-directed RNA polymerase subunit beta'